MKLFGKKTPSESDKDKMCMQASYLQMEGEKRRGSDDLAGAIRNYEQALDLFRRAEEPLGQARIMQGLGMLYRDAKKFQEGEDYFNQALQIFRDLNDTYRQGTTCDRMGTLYWEKGDLRRAIEMYSQAGSLLLKAGKPGEAMESLNSAGSLEIEESHYAEGERIERQVLALAQQNQSYELESSASYHLAYALSKLGRTAEAIQNYQRVLHIYQKTGYEGHSAHVYKELKRLGALPESQTAQSSAIHPDIAEAFRFFEQGQPQIAMNKLRELSGRFESQRDWLNAASACESMGQVHQNLGQVPEALEKYHRSREFFQQCGEKDSLARITLRIETIQQEMHGFEL